MEYCGGGDLHKKLQELNKKKEPVPEQLAVTWIAQCVCCARWWLRLLFFAVIIVVLISVFVYSFVCLLLAGYFLLLLLQLFSVSW
jgi:hypothetical protein